jgi:hypothetical protein
MNSESKEINICYDKIINDSTISHSEKIIMLSSTYSQFYDKLIDVSKLTRFSKLTIDNNHNLRVQIWTPWRLLYRKITKQNTLLSLETIQNYIEQFVLFNKTIIDLRDTLFDSYITLISSNYNLVRAITPNIKYLRDTYNVSGDKYKNHSIYLEKIYNELIKIEKNVLVEISNFKRV